jgi:hypothetical protein
MGFMDFLSKVGRGAQKVYGMVREPLKKIGQIGMSVGRFAVANHQPIAMALQGVSDMMPNNRVLQGVAGAGMLASGALTARGIGRDYLGARPQ